MDEEIFYFYKITSILKYKKVRKFFTIIDNCSVSVIIQSDVKKNVSRTTMWLPSHGNKHGVTIGTRTRNNQLIVWLSLYIFLGREDRIHGSEGASTYNTYARWARNNTIGRRQGDITRTTGHRQRLNAIWSLQFSCTPLCTRGECTRPWMP